MRIIDSDAHPPFGVMDIEHIGTLTPTSFFERLGKAGIGTAAGTLLLPPEVRFSPPAEETLRRINSAAFALADAYHDRYFPGIHVNPALPEASCREIESYGRQGVRFLGEILPEWLRDPDFHGPISEIFACAGHFEMIVSVHPAVPDHLKAWAGKFPDLKFMYGSRQCGNITPDISAALLSEYPNLFLRLSQDIFLGNYYLYTYIDRFPHDRILFGSGYPLCNPAARKAGCLWELRSQPEETRRKIFYRNAAALSGRYPES